MSEHFNDIWCWDRGREALGGRWKPNTLHSRAGARGALGVQEAPGEDHLGESHSSTGFSSSLTSSTEEKALLEGSAVKNG